MAAVRVVLDTNVLISGLAYPLGNPGRILAGWRQGRVQVVLSRYILDEMTRVLSRLPRFAMSEAELLDIADSFLFLADIVEPDKDRPAKEKELRDPADRLILGTLLAARADYLVTGDKDLLVLAARNSIITPADFCNRHDI
jgi:uncharacterized protein